jgi:hypothetical protein
MRSRVSCPTGWPANIASDVGRASGPGPLDSPQAPNGRGHSLHSSPGNPSLNGRFAMSHAKRASKRRGRMKAVTVLGVAGALSLAGGASGAAVGPPGDALTTNTAITLDEEEISDVSLSTFYVFDHEIAGAHRPGLQLAQRTRSRPRQGCGGCAGDCGGGGPTCCASCASGGGPDGS